MSTLENARHTRAGEGPALRALEGDAGASTRRRWSLPAAARPVLVWAVAIVLAEVAGGALGGPEIAVAAIAGAVIAATVTGPARLLGFVAMLPAALAPDAPLWAWMAGGAALALTAASAGQIRAPAAVPARQDDLRRHLARARRRHEQVRLLVVPAADEEAARALLGNLRWTDSAEIARHGGGHELHCLLDAHGLDRRGVERRLRAAARRPVALGWATFPDDGLTVDALLDAARDRLSARPPSEAPTNDVPAESAQHVAQSTSPGG